MNGEHRVEQMREMNALGLGHQAEEGAVAVEAPRPSLLDDLEIGLAIAIKQLVADPSSRVFVG